MEGYSAREAVRCTRPLRGSPEDPEVWRGASPRWSRSSSYSDPGLPTAAPAERELNSPERTEEECVGETSIHLLKHSF